MSVTTKTGNKMKIRKKHLINLLVRESRLGSEWGPLTKKGARNIVNMIKDSR